MILTAKSAKVSQRTLRLLAIFFALFAVIFLMRDVKNAQVSDTTKMSQAQKLENYKLYVVRDTF